MKLFAPRNTANWDMASPDSSWQYIGSVPSSSGKMISEETAKTFSAVFAATRIISEGIAQLPCAVLEQVDYRTTRKATDHPLWRIVHDVPNPEQDKMTWFDMQTAFLPNWGNSYSEIQRDGQQIAALWPIHPSRIPLGNITRNTVDPASYFQIHVGQPGELVYWIKNDDNTLTPIPASDMLHVPGVLSSNGITGQSIVRWAANSIGIAISTEDHAGAFFKNGALSNLVIKHPKILGKEAADRLRASWQQTFAGTRNAYKALIMEEGMDVTPISVSPEDTQLILARQFSVSEIARWWKVPPHMLGDLSRSTFSNIEQQYLEFVVHSLGPWVTRWESAMYRQLLTREEQKRYRFKFNLNAMLRGDQAARSAFYQSLFGMGVVSPNDIRELEDWNPVEGGDQRFVPGNNLIPLDKAGELAQAQIDKLNAPPQTPAPAAPQAAPEPPVDMIRELARFETRDLIGGISAEFAKNVDKIGEIHQEIAKLPEKLAEIVEIRPIPDTAAAEIMAVREAALAREQAAIGERLEAERETTRQVLTLALKRSLDQLADWETKAMLKAVEKPTEWVSWRSGWYSRFRKHFEANLSEFCQTFEACGVVLDLPWGADRYSARSIEDLKTLDPFAADNYYDRVKEGADHFRKRDWIDRTQTLAAEMIARGQRLFQERKTHEAV